MNTSARRVGQWAAIVAVLAAFLPWASVSVEIVGVRFSGAASAKGIDIGSIAGLSYGWAMIGLACASALAFARPSGWLLFLGVVTGAFGLYAAFDAVHHVTLVPGVAGQYVNALLQPHVAARYGAYLEGLAACTILGAAIVAFRSSRADTLAVEAAHRSYRLD